MLGGFGKSIYTSSRVLSSYRNAWSIWEHMVHMRMQGHCSAILTFLACTRYQFIELQNSHNIYQRGMVSWYHELLDRDP